MKCHVRPLDPDFKRLLAALALCLPMLAIPACNTTEGIGEDLEEAGEEIEEAAEDAGD